MKEELLVMRCDQCDRKKSYNKKTFGIYPFNGWLHVQMECSLGASEQHDFCSKKCLIDFFQGKGENNGNSEV